MISRSSKSGTKNSLIKTFTYFVPAPPARKSGYREREFDKIMQGILTSGFQIIDLHTQSVETGIFIIAVLKASHKKAFALDENLDLQEMFKLTHSHSSPDFIMDDQDDA